MTVATERHVRWEGLEAFARTALTAQGAPEAAAATVATVLVRTEARGVTSHGVRLLPGYLRQLAAGGVRAGAEVRVDDGGGVSAVVDGGSGFGMVVATRATEVAIEKASANGMALVVARASNHLGASGHYALQCAEAGLIGLVFTNAPPVMKVTGSRGAVLGNNPIAYGIPRSGAFPIVFDVALSVAAGGRVRLAAELGETVPEGWFVDADGRPSRDPKEYLRGGALVPLADHKGYGLALLVECLAGVLSGAATGSDIGNWARDPATPTDTGHAFLVIKPDLFTGSFGPRLDHLTEAVTGAPRADGVDRILLPGELEFGREQRAREHGIPLAAATWDSLLDVAPDDAARDALVDAGGAR
jgi:LDH2 family malate/lactate/ureidoglycolate dehydrogenase